MHDTPASSGRPRTGWLFRTTIALSGLVVLLLLFEDILHHGAHPPARDAGPPPLWGIGILPFVLLLAAIAVMPLVPRTRHWWEHNRNRFLLSLTLSGATLLYIALVQGPALVAPTLQHAIPGEYVPFIVLLFSLYVVTGGIHIQGGLTGTPLSNASLLAFGAGIASVVGTTGASMLLIRPLLRANRGRVRVGHTLVFFIFLVSNIGGTLLPVGDPPLYLGYLAGVPFFWTLGLWKPWLLTCVVLLALYVAWDTVAWRDERRRHPERTPPPREPLRAAGLWNVPLLVGVIGAVAFIEPSRPLPLLGVHPFPYLRELVMLMLAAASLRFTPRPVREANGYSYAAIAEVAALFCGIFITMQVPIALLRSNADVLQSVLSHPAQFFWSTGSLSSVLDNAPTYIVFFELGRLSPAGADVVALGEAGAKGAIPAAVLTAVSLGAVFMGAMTYIGNGPNFMVKAIAEQQGVRMPTFFGYVFRYSIPILVPVFALMSMLFLR
ncbi:MAG: sodium:proton antiporter [Phycisphaeraceae bacterium]|nr:sodium:proton antiporter [Phycisphaeraceae bacterium]